jgi:hypothetical protein
VGVVGLEVGVGIVLMDADVLMLLLSVFTDIREPDRRLTLFWSELLVLRSFEFGLLVMDVSPLNADGAVGLDVLLRSFVLSLIGEGESSMMSTQPESPPAGVLVRSPSQSTLRLLV